jgi:hypothetical protein
MPRLGHVRSLLSGPSPSQFFGADVHPATTDFDDDVQSGIRGFDSGSSVHGAPDSDESSIFAGQGPDTDESYIFAGQGPDTDESYIFAGQGPDSASKANFHSKDSASKANFHSEDYTLNYKRTSGSGVKLSFNLM